MLSILLRNPYTHMIMGVGTCRERSEVATTSHQIFALLDTNSSGAKGSLY